jgi:preprotein translocase YajC subunit
MNVLLLLTLAQEGAPAAPPEVSPFAGMAPIFLIALLFIVFMVFMRRSQKRQQAEHHKMVEGLSSGAKVMLNSGLIARVDRIDRENQEARVVIDEDKKVHATYNLLAIAKVFDEQKSSVKKDYK